MSVSTPYRFRCRQVIAEDFAWERSIYLVQDNSKFDLHNDFDFQSFSYDVENRTVVLVWSRGTGEWVQASLPNVLRLEMTGISEVRISPRDPKIPFTEDNCLSSFGYASDDDWTDGQFWVDSSPDKSWRWSFLFMSGAEIQITGERAKALRIHEAPDAD